MDWVAFAEMKFGIRLKKVGPTEWAGPCPWCGGRDRWHMWERGNYFCRSGPGHCGRSGWLDEIDGAKALTKDELVEIRLAALERKSDDHERRLSVIEQMHECEDYLRYHKNLEANVQAVEYWLSEGMNGHTIANRKLGYCPNCPTAPGRDSYTIPVLAAGKLWNIRHRLVQPNGGGKYRPHMAGLPAMLYNADDITTTDKSRILILEGEKKSMVVTQETGIPNIATMGMQSFKPDWAKKLAQFQQVIVCYDPDALEKAADVASLFQRRGRVMALPLKADEFFFRWGGSKGAFLDYVNRARPV